MIYIFFLLFILGTCLGSFISCVAYRYKLGISIIYPRSFCDNCSQTLQHWQLIPIIGFILQKGKCRFCKQKIPLSSTVIELAIGVIFIFNTIIIANTNLIFTSLLVVWLTLISLEDYYTLSVDSITLEYGGLILLIFRFHTVITNLKANFLIIILFIIILSRQQNFQFCLLILPGQLHMIYQRTDLDPLHGFCCFLQSPVRQQNPAAVSW